jgi:hypothetical protein
VDVAIIMVFTVSIVIIHPATRAWRQLRTFLPDIHVLHGNGVRKYLAFRAEFDLPDDPGWISPACIELLGVDPEQLPLSTSLLVHWPGGRFQMQRVKDISQSMDLY